MQKLNLLSLVILILFGSISLTSCNNQELTEQDKTEITKEIEARVNGYAEACKQLDGEYMKGFWADTEDFVFAGDGTFTSNTEWRAQLDGLFDEIQSFTKMDISDMKVYVYSDNAASCAIGFDWSFINTAGETVSSHGTWLYVFTIIDDEWRVVHTGGHHIYT